MSKSPPFGFQNSEVRIQKLRGEKSFRLPDEKCRRDPVRKTVLSRLDISYREKLAHWTGLQAEQKKPGSNVNQTKTRRKPHCAKKSQAPSKSIRGFGGIMMMQQPSRSAQSGGGNHQRRAVAVLWFLFWVVALVALIRLEWGNLEFTAAFFTTVFGKDEWIYAWSASIVISALEFLPPALFFLAWRPKSDWLWVGLVAFSIAFGWFPDFFTTWITLTLRVGDLAILRQFGQEAISLAKFFVALFMIVMEPLISLALFVVIGLWRRELFPQGISGALGIGRSEHDE